jgi:hypothetical protein
MIPPSNLAITTRKPTIYPLRKALSLRGDSCRFSAHAAPHTPNTQAQTAYKQQQKKYQQGVFIGLGMVAGGFALTVAGIGFPVLLPVLVPVGFGLKIIGLGISLISGVQALLLKKPPATPNTPPGNHPPAPSTTTPPPSNPTKNKKPESKKSSGSGSRSSSSSSSTQSWGRYTASSSGWSMPTPKTPTAPKPQPEPKIPENKPQETPDTPKPPQPESDQEPKPDQPDLNHAADPEIDVQPETIVPLTKVVEEAPIAPVAQPVESQEIRPDIDAHIRTIVPFWDELLEHYKNYQLAASANFTKMQKEKSLSEAELLMERVIKFETILTMYSEIQQEVLAFAQQHQLINASEQAYLQQLKPSDNLKYRFHFPGNRKAPALGLKLTNKKLSHQYKNLDYKQLMGLVSNS